jgi:alpha-tubulin suppressor-like RCC1 family protein
MKDTPIYIQSKPHQQDTKNIIGFSCGSSHIIAVESGGDIYGLGSNESFQLGMNS